MDEKTILERLDRLEEQQTKIIEELAEIRNQLEDVSQRVNDCRRLAENPPLMFE